MTHVAQQAIHGWSDPVPYWVIEGLAEYEGTFNSTDHIRRVGMDKLRRYVRESIPDSIFLASSLGSDTPHLSTSDVYFGGNLIMTYLAEAFGEDIHNRLLRHSGASFNAALEAEFEAAGTTMAQVFEALKEWLGEGS